MLNAQSYEIKANNSSLFNSFLTSNENKSPLVKKDETDLTVKHPNLFKISIEKLVAIIQEGEKRTFTEDIDKLEVYGRKNNTLFFI